MRESSLPKLVSALTGFLYFVLLCAGLSALNSCENQSGLTTEQEDFDTSLIGPGDSVRTFLTGNRLLSFYWDMKFVDFMFNDLKPAVTVELFVVEPTELEIERVAIFLDGKEYQAIPDSTYNFAGQTFMIQKNTAGTFTFSFPTPIKGDVTLEFALKFHVAHPSYFTNKDCSYSSIYMKKFILQQKDGNITVI